METIKGPGDPLGAARLLVLVYDVAEVASGPITASGDSITVQLIQPTDSRSVIMIIWPVGVGKFLILEAAVDRSYSVAGPNTRQERRS